MSASPNPDPSSIPERTLARAMWTNIWAGALGMIWMAASYGIPLPLYLEAIGSSGRQLGIVGAIRQSAMVWQIVGAFIAERLSFRKPMWLVIAFLHRLLWLTPALLPVLLPDGREWYVPLTVAALALSDIFANVSTAPWLSWMSDLLPPERSGRFWGIRSRVHSVVLILASAGFGYLLDRHRDALGLHGFVIVFTIAGIAGMADIVVHAFVYEPRPKPHPHREPVFRRLARPLKDPTLRQLTWVFAIYSCAIGLPGIASGLPGFFNIVYLHDAFGATYSEASLVFIASAAGAVLLSPRIGHLIDRHGARRVALVLMLSGVAGTLTWFFVSPGRSTIAHMDVPKAVLLMSAASVWIGASYSGVFLCQLRLSQQHTPAEGRTVALAVHWSIVGLVASIGPIVAGFVKDRFPADWSQWTLPGGAAFSFFQVIIGLQAILICFIAVPLLVRIRRA